MAVQRYFEKDITINNLAKELKLLTPTFLKDWIHIAHQQGLRALAVKRHRSNYSLTFKAKVVEYYQIHDLGVSKVDVIFNVSASQVYYLE